MKSVDAILAERRERARRVRDQRVRELYARAPEWQQLQEQKQAKGRELVLLALQNDRKAQEQVREALHDLEEKERTLRKQLGISAEFFEPTYTCPRCRDEGFVDGQSCQCRTQLLIERNYDMSSIRRVLERENFSTFDLGRFRRDRQAHEPLSPYENMRSLRQNLEEDYVGTFTAHGEQASPDLFFYGPTGVGKTFLLNCVAKGVLDRGYTVLYQSAPQLLEFLASYQFMYESDRQRNETRYQFCRSAELLLIDDLGSEYTTAPMIAQFFSLLNGRMMEGLPTILSSNLKPEELGEQYNERIASRISGNFALFELFGSDLRRQV